MADNDLFALQNSLREEGWPEHALAVPDEILPGVYVSGIAFTKDLPTWCNQNGFTHILNACGKHGRKGFYKSHPHSHNLNYLELDMLDEPHFNIRPHMQSVFTFLDTCYTQQGKVLIHCMWGQSRSVSCLTYFIMKKYNIDYEDAVDLIKFVRPEAHPNSGFQRQLRSL